MEMNKDTCGRRSEVKKVLACETVTVGQLGAILRIALTCRKQYKGFFVHKVSILVWEMTRAKLSRTLPLLLIIQDRKYVGEN